MHDVGGAVAPPEARQGLRRQGDLGHQHQYLAAAAEHIGDGAQVDLGLAAAGNAFKQVRREAVQCLLIVLDGRILIRGQSWRSLRIEAALARLDGAFANQGGNHGGSESRSPNGLAAGPAAVAVQEGEQRLLPLGTG